MSHHHSVGEVSDIYSQHVLRKFGKSIKYLGTTATNNFIHEETKRQIKCDECLLQFDSESRIPAPV